MHDHAKDRSICDNERKSEEDAETSPAEKMIDHLSQRDIFDRWRHHQQNQIAEISFPSLPLATAFPSTSPPGQALQIDRKCREVSAQ